MVNIDGRLERMGIMVDNGVYFTVSRARQYGKTTALRLLKKRLSDNYVVLSISLEGVEKEVYESTISFCRRICRLLYNAARYGGITGIPDRLLSELCQMKSGDTNLADLADFISELCASSARRVVLIIDEVDQASDKEVFMSFLGMLRNQFLNRDERPAFWSVVLASVYDIKNLKLRIRPDAEHHYNSPWNIAEDFTPDMNFSTKDISGMLSEYETDHHTGMDICEMAALIYDYTGGYPFLVSRLCKILDSLDLTPAWNREGMTEAVKSLLMEENPLFDDMTKKLDDLPELEKILYAVLFKGEKIPYSPDNYAVNIGLMFGFLKNSGGAVAISNRIFETRLYNLFLSREALESGIYKAAAIDGNRFICEGQLDMELVLERFVEAFNEIYSDAAKPFVEENGRRFFLLFLKPIINGVGNYYVEARTRDMRRTDIIIDYRGRQYVCELKIWHGDEYNRRREQQLCGYLEDYGLDIGYLISFNFNKNKKTGVSRRMAGDKVIVEAVV